MLNIKISDHARQFFDNLTEDAAREMQQKAFAAMERAIFSAPFAPDLFEPVAPCRVRRKDPMMDRIRVRHNFIFGTERPRYSHFHTASDYEVPTETEVKFSDADTALEHELAAEVDTEME